MKMRKVRRRWGWSYMNIVVISWLLETLTTIIIIIAIVIILVIVIVAAYQITTRRTSSLLNSPSITYSTKSIPTSAYAL